MKNPNFESTAYSKIEEDFNFTRKNHSANNIQINNICGCDHIDIIVENFKTSFQQNTKHSSLCTKIKPRFTKDWLDKLRKIFE